MNEKRKELIRRSKALVKSLRDVAERIELGKLTPGVEEAISAGGAPVCAFGWAIVGAQKKLKTVPLAGMANNYDTLREFLNGDYDEGVPYDVQIALKDAVAVIEQVNDDIFNPENAKEGKVKYPRAWRRQVSSAVRKAARVLEKRIVLAKPEAVEEAA